MVTMRQVRSLHTAFHTVEGDGVDVLRAIPGTIGESVGPFIFLDHYGPIPYVPGEAKGASAHPHAGIETLSLLIEGRMRHKDSLGNESVMGPGDIQWMRAGRGIIHDEQPETASMQVGGSTHGVQLWINMPKGSKHLEPRYFHVGAAAIPILEDREQHVRSRLIAGRISERCGPVETAGAPFVVHASFSDAGALRLETGPIRELGVYVMTGAVHVGEARDLLEPGVIAQLSEGDGVIIHADRPTELLMLGGDPLDAPILRYGPFVMNSREELQRAVTDFQLGRMGRISA